MHSEFFQILSAFMQLVVFILQMCIPAWDMA